LEISDGAAVLKTITYRALIATVLGVALGACSTITNAQARLMSLAQSTSLATPSRQAAGPVRRASPMTERQEADLVYKILAAEIAGRRGRVDLAAQNYSDAANATDDPRVSERAVKLALYSRDFDRADGAVRRWVELEPDSVDAWQHRAQVSLRQKNVDDTTNALEQVINLSDEPPSMVIGNVVNSILRQSDSEVGAQVLDQLGERFPDSADTQYGIGRFAMSRGERETALKAFEKALEIDPDNVEALLSRARLQVETGNVDDALQPVEDFLASNDDNVAGQLGYARLLVEAGKYERATTRFDIISEQFPDDADAFLTIGLLALEIKRVRQAEEYLERVIELDQHLDEAYYYLARISDSGRDYQKAIDRYQSVQGGDNFFSAQIRSAELHGLVGEVEKGRELITNLKTYTDEPAIQIELITSESRLLNSDDQHEESLSVLSDGLSRYPDDASLLYARALVAERLDKREMFEADLQKVITAQPDNGYALNALGYFLVDRNERLDEAEKYLTRAIELQPSDPAIIDSVGWLYYRQKRYDEAIEMLRKAYDILPDAEIAAHLGEVLWVTGDEASATQVWEEALKTSPDDDVLNEVMQKYLR
jgi:tetratricopeptide (TPR) repeat protein